MNSGNPVIIPRAGHPISRRMLSPNALRVLYRLRDNGFIAYLVGGSVRDLLLGREPKDFDIATDATPGQIKRLFRNCRLVGRRFRLAHLHFPDELIEVSTFRSNLSDDSGPEEAPEEREGGRPPRHQKSEEGMVLRDNLFGTPEQDALRRDFTVNALAYNIDDFSIIDHAGGVEDLRRGVVRTIGDPHLRFTEDPVRMLRAVRFAALLGFEIETATWDAIIDRSGAIALASPPRLYEEILKLLLLGEGEKCYQLLRRTGLFKSLFPAFSVWLDQETDGFPHIRVGKGLELVDQRIREGGEVSPQLVLALMFGEYLEEKQEGLAARGAHPQQATDLALAEFPGEVVPFIRIPHKTGLQLREIIGSQRRFGKIPGRQPGSFVRRPSFGTALDYLGITSRITGEGVELHQWWTAFANANPEPAGPAAAAETGAAGRGRKRKRRKRRKRTTSPPSA